MSITRSLRNCFVLCALTASLIQLVPLTASAGGSTITVEPPNGSDDTNNIQKALNACVAQGPGCTVQLQAGTYLTKQLVTYNFQGTFKGMGQDNTTIEALYPLTVNVRPPGGSTGMLCQPNTTTCPWPSLIMFVNGDIHVSDLSLVEHAPPGMATTLWEDLGIQFLVLLDVLHFSGQHANAYVDRVHMEGSTDPTNNLGGGFNVINGMHFNGTFPRSPAYLDFTS
jgi:hypothetical protein